MENMVRKLSLMLFAFNWLCLIYICINIMHCLVVVVIVGLD